jgi:hypothetical protein
VVAGKRASMTMRSLWQTTRNDKNVQQIMRAATTRERAARVMVMVMRVVGNNQDGGSKGNGISNKGGVQ